VVEDAAQGVNATYKGQYLGGMGDLGCFSFHETKNFISGEGGALAINNPEFKERAEIIRDKGTNRKKFFRGEVDKYTWVDLGSSYLPSELTAAFLYAQLEESQGITRKRREIFSYYMSQLNPLQEAGLVRLPYTPDSCGHNGHIFYVLLRDEAQRNELSQELRAQNIIAVSHYEPLHTSPMGRQFGYRGGELPVTESFAARVLRLPCYFELERHDQDRVIDIIKEFVTAKK